MSNSKKDLLIVDDDIEAREMLKEFLEIEGFAPTLVPSGEEALDALAATTFDAIILDIGLPGIDGIEVLRQIRRQWATPVIMLTARGDPIDRIVGLEVGADDYVPKPFHPRELLARLRGLLRRAHGAVTSEPISVGSLRLEPGALRAEVDGTALRLTGAEFRVLECLMRQAGSVVSREALTEQALDRALAPYDRSIDTHIANLRKKLRRVRRDPPIRTVRGAGFLFVADDAGAASD